MYTQHLELWSKIITGTHPNGMLRLAMRHVGYRLSDILKRPIKISNMCIETVTINELMMIAGDPEAETVGIYLLSGDDLPGQAVLMLSASDAMYMTDWLLEVRPGTTTKLGQLEYSALAEAGNLTLAAFLNALADFTDSQLRLSPPAVAVDTLATIVQTISTSVGPVTEELLIIETDFKDANDSIWIRFWLLPDPALLMVNPAIAN